MKLNQVLKALNSPIRREIIAHLRNGPLSAGELADRFDVSKPTMSTHFAALKDADLIESRKQGVSIVYSLNVTVVEEALGALMGLLRTGNDTSSQTSPDKSPGKEIRT